MDLIKGKLCFCGSGKKIEECCINFESKVKPEVQMKMRQKYGHLNEEEDVILLARHIEDTVELDDYLLTDEDEKMMERCSSIINNKRSMEKFYQLFSSEYVIIAKYENDIRNGKVKSNRDDINRMAINFVSNAKLFIDFLENYLKNHYPERFPVWKKLQSKFFDESNEYPIMYHLRNHVQHVGLPIHAIKRKLVNKDDKECTEVEFFLSKEDLLNDKKLNKHAEKRIREMQLENDNIPFMPLVQEYSGMIQALYLLALKIFFDVNKEELKHLEEYFTSRDFTERIYTARVKKKYYINGTYEGMTMTPLYGRADIHNLYIELEKAGVIKVRIN